MNDEIASIIGKSIVWLFGFILFMASALFYIITIVAFYETTKDTILVILSMFSPITFYLGYKICNWVVNGKKQ